MTANARTVAALAIAGLLLLLLTRIESVQAPPLTGLDERAGSAPAAVEARGPLEGRHRNVLVIPRNRGGSPRERSGTRRPAVGNPDATRR